MASRYQMPEYSGERIGFVQVPTFYPDSRSRQAQVHRASQLRLTRAMSVANNLIHRKQVQ